MALSLFLELICMFGSSFSIWMHGISLGASFSCLGFARFDSSMMLLDGSCIDVFFLVVDLGSS